LITLFYPNKFEQFKAKAGVWGNPAQKQSMEDRKLPPTVFWELNDCIAPELAEFAIKVLSHVCI
jgi:hypothetical protein